MSFVGRLSRSLARRFRRRRPTLFFHPGYSVEITDLSDARRAEKILGYLVREGCLAAQEVCQPAQVGAGLLHRAHSWSYLEAVDRPETALKVFGTELPPARLEQIRLAQRWMVAGTVAAARHAWQEQERVVNVGGGLHHARAEQGAGFCLFNDVAVAIQQLRAEGFEGRVLVIDVDLHHGDGTRSIFAEDESVFTLSLHATHWDEAPAVANLDIELGTAVTDGRYLAALGGALQETLERFPPALVFIVAGVDGAASDRLGSWLLSEEGLLSRDQLIYEAIGQRPSVYTLAGGYGDDAWRYSARTLGWLLCGQAPRIPASLERYLRSFRDVQRSLDPRSLSAEEEPSAGGAFDFDLDFTEEELFGHFGGYRAPTRLLGYYTVYGVELALERYGLAEHLASRGYPAIEVVFKLDTARGEMVQIVTRDARRDLLVELVLAKTTADVGGEAFTLLHIEWLLAQDPRKTPTRALLPGQKHPGLGALPRVLGMLVMVCERLDIDGLGWVPSRYHVAVQAKTQGRFLDPRLSARFLALHELLVGRGLSQASALVESGAVRDEQGAPVLWEPGTMVMAVSERLQGALRARDAEAEQEGMEPPRWSVHEEPPGS